MEYRIYRQGNSGVTALDFDFTADASRWTTVVNLAIEADIITEAGLYFVTRPGRKTGAFVNVERVSQPLRAVEA